MNSLHIGVRRLLLPAAGILLSVSALLIAAPPAHALDIVQLSLKGVGNNYISYGNPTVARAGASGQTLTYGVKVANYGDSERQYVLSLQQSGLSAEVGLYDGSKLIRIASTPAGYVTPPIPPTGGEVVYTLKIKAFDANVSWRATAVTVLLKGRDGATFGNETARFEMKAPAKGSSNADVTARQGSQAYVGSRWDTQYTQAPYVGYNKSAKFTVKAAVNAGAPHRLRVYIPLTNPQCHTFTVTDGTTDVTAAVQAGTYYTKILGPGQSSLLTVTNTKKPNACLPQYLNVYGAADGEGFTTTVSLIAP